MAASCTGAPCATTATTPGSAASAGGTSAEDAAEEEPEANPGERTLAASCVAGDAEPAGSQRGLIRQGGGWEKKIERHAWVRPNDLKRERGAATGGAG